MKTLTAFLTLVAVTMLAVTASAQVIVPSYQRTQPFVFCDSIPQGDELTVPFDIVNNGNTYIVVDSAVAAGDTADFYANFLVGSDQHYLNPINWRFLNGRTIEPHGVFFGSFFFTPKTPGPKQLTVTLYYHDTTAALSTQATFGFTTSLGRSGLAFLRLVTDTVSYGSSVGYSSITYDRVPTYTDAIVRDTLDLGDTVRAALVGENRLDLSSCGGAVIVAVDTRFDTPGDSFSLRLPALPFALASGDSMLLDYIYIARAIEIPYRTAVATFRTNAGDSLSLRLEIVMRKPSGVAAPDAPITTGNAVASLAGLPNPFNGSTTVRVAVPRPAQARVEVLNELGMRVALLADERLDAGVREFRFDADGLPVGAYFVRCAIDADVRTYRLMLVR